MLIVTIFDAAIFLRRHDIAADIAATLAALFLSPCPLMPFSSF